MECSVVLGITRGCGSQAGPAVSTAPAVRPLDLLPYHGTKEVFALPSVLLIVYTRALPCPHALSRPGGIRDAPQCTLSCLYTRTWYAVNVEVTAVKTALRPISLR